MNAGDAAFTKAEVYAQIVEEAREETSPWVAVRVSRSGSCVTVGGVDGAHVESFDVTGALSCGTGADAVFDMLGKNLLDWVWSGFNASLILQGSALAANASVMHADGFAGLLLAGLFHRIQADSAYFSHAAAPVDNVDTSGYLVGLSAWEVDSSDGTNYDVFASHVPYTCAPSASCTVWVRHLPAAIELLRVLGKRPQSTAGSYERHRFTRVVLFNRAESCVSTLHIVDPFTSSISAARSFAGVIRKIAMAGGNRLPDAPIAPTSENSSDNNGLRKINYGIMSQCLLPLLAGNCRHIFAVAEFFAICVESKSNILRCCSCLHISSACARHRNIEEQA